MNQSCSHLIIAPSINRTNHGDRDPWQGLVMQVSGSLVEVDILELTESPLTFSIPAWDWATDGEGIRPDIGTGNG